MPVEDPGWGDYTPLPGEPPPGQAPTQPQPPVQPEQRAPAPRPSGGGSGKTPLRIGLGALVALALAAGGYFFLAGDDPDETSDERPAAAITDDEASEAGDDATPSEETALEEETPDAGETPGSDGDLPTTAEYVVAADEICRRFTPDINEASQDNDIRRLVRLYKAMVDRLSLQVLPPGEDGDVIQGMLDDFFEAAEALPHDYELALSYASAAQTTAFQMGFEDCSEA